ncbi:PBPRA1643 family SWIM/SEC-C metal-binding motif protein [Litoribacillus peritrichatus]|uniref:SEC-C metal-binding domain-containing protein n=1 Tax=Litoribacillus peritrichatus TaxID=718191 RepID=A0ABP7MTP8_9GAMM
MADKFFFKGRKQKKPKHSSYGFSTNRDVKPGTEDSPLTLIVTSEERKAEVETLLSENELFGTIEVNPETPEDIKELEALINTPKTQVFEKKPNRNDPCSCGSGKKYKKCCG